jgi:hypothetical protein
MVQAARPIVTVFATAPPIDTINDAVSPKGTAAGTCTLIW